jgi:hypothetical protein
MAVMSNRDSAFLWETEALRASPLRGEVSDPPTSAPDPERHWVTLREGHYLTGIPIETLRKWARKDAIPTFLNESEIGVRRMIRMDAVRERAARLGRPIAPIPRPSPDPRVSGAESPTPAAEPGPEQAPPRDASLPSPEADGGAAEPAEPDGGASGAPPGTMIVPIAAWDKMLMQLGNLHEAGQQLAEARERAAKAETEASFLRDRLGELRNDLESSRREVAQSSTPVASPPEAKPAEPEAPEEPTPEVAPAPRPSPVVQPAPPRQPEKLWRYIYRGWRQRRR